MIENISVGKSKLLNAAIKLVRTKGYSATSVDDLCKEAGVTKGAFFHHFKSKEDLGVKAAGYWTDWTNQIFAAAEYHHYEDPLDQLIGYVDFRMDILKGRSLPEFTCLLGTMVQETYETHPTLRDACGASISSHLASLEHIVAKAKARHVPDASWTPESLALHMQAVIQGAFILAKARNTADAATGSLRHLRRYLELLFQKTQED